MENARKKLEQKRDEERNISTQDKKYHNELIENTRNITSLVKELQKLRNEGEEDGADTREAVVKDTLQNQIKVRILLLKI